MQCIFMKRTHAIMLVVSGVLVVACLVCFALFRSDSVRVATDRINSLDAEKIVVAAKTYANDLKEKGMTIPSSVDMRELVAKGLLSHENVKCFDGMEVTISLIADETRPNESLIRVRMKDGMEVALMADGSIQQWSNKRTKAGQSNSDISGNQ